MDPRSIAAISALLLVGLTATPGDAKDPPAKDPTPSPKAEPKPNPKAEPKSAPKAEPKSSPKAEPKSSPKPNPKPDPKDPVSPKDPKATGGGRNWDFEDGLAGWTRTGDAFANQPTLGDNVIAGRVRTEMALARGGIGGDYWKRVPFPIGHHAGAWIGTGENHPDATAPLGALQSDARRGTLTSGEFPLDNAHRFIAFMIGGGRDVTTQRVELQVFGDSPKDIASLTGIIRGNRDAAAALAALLTGTPPHAVANGVGTRDGSYVIALTASGQNSEQMRPVVFDVPANLRGRRGRIRIVDDGGGSWGHISADDFRFGAAQPHLRPRPVWGFADTHAHPMNDLAFGGNVVQGSMYARDGSAFASARFRKRALPPMFEDISWAQLGSIGGLLAPFYAGGPSAIPGFPPLGPIGGAVAGEAARELSRPMRSGYPQLQGYPASSQMLGQQMYGEWIRRAYDGGLRLMSALAVNNWLVSSHPIKRRVLGGSAPEDDKGSADAQIADMKAFVQRPENRTWVEIALTPEDARRIIGDNKLAIVLGVELDTLGNFVPNDHWREPGAVVLPNNTADQRRVIAAEVARLHALGVRQIGPFHYVSGVFGGTSISERMFNEVSRKVTGRNIAVQSGDVEGIRYRIDEDAWGPIGDATRAVATGDDPHLQVDPTWDATRLGHRNKMGLSKAGEIMFDELADRGMLIDLDHSSLESSLRLMELASARDYPIMSSHSDFMELGFTGQGDFSHGAVANNDADNLRLFDTSLIGPLRHEGMVTRRKIETIAKLGGTTGAIMWLPRRKPWGSGVPNDCEGSSKTWAQSYQYASERMGGNGVALSTDRITMYPRFGPNAAFLLGLESTAMADRDQRRFAQVDAQDNGVRYDSPIVEWRAFRFKAGVSAWNKTPVEHSHDWESRPAEHGDAWTALAAWSAGRNPRTSTTHGIDGGPRVIDYAWGFTARNEADLEADGAILPTTLDSRFAAYCAKQGITPDGLHRFRNAPGIWTQYRWVKRAWDEWQRMSGSNAPLRRHKFGDRDFDVNLDGVAHYGMLPDFLQDLANSHRHPAQVGAYLHPLFSSAEAYIQMWEKAVARQ